MRLILIRHAATKGNLEHRYVGCTDEVVCESGRKQLSELAKKLHAINNNFMLSSGNVKIFSSPLIRCRETAEILFPGYEIQAVDEFAECNFGEFEYKNHRELDGNADYQKYIDSGGEAAFPGGESKRDFSARCIRGFEYIMNSVRNANSNPANTGSDTIVIVAHGGTIMALLDAFSQPHKNYFEWQLGNAEGYLANLDIQDDNGAYRYQISNTVKISVERDNDMDNNMGNNMNGANPNAAPGVENHVQDNITNQFYNAQVDLNKQFGAIPQPYMPQSDGMNIYGMNQPQPDGMNMYANSMGYNMGQMQNYANATNGKNKKQKKYVRPETPEERKQAQILGLISIGCELIPFILYFLYQLGEEVVFTTTRYQTVALPEPVVNILGTLALLSLIAGFVIMIVIRVKYPQNTMGKALMWTYVSLMIIAFIIFITLLVFCVLAVKACVDACIDSDCGMITGAGSIVANCLMFIR